MVFILPVLAFVFVIYIKMASASNAAEVDTPTDIVCDLLRLFSSHSFEEQSIKMQRPMPNLEATI